MLKLPNFQRLLVVDIESTGLSPRKDLLHGVATAWESEGKVFSKYWPTWEGTGPLRKALADASWEKLGHNFRFDLRFLFFKGFDVQGPFWDSRLLAHVLDENGRTGLKELTERYFGGGKLEAKNELDKAVDDVGGKSVADLCRLDLSDRSRPYAALIGEYAKEDARNTLALFKELWRRLAESDARAKSVLGVAKGPLDFYLADAQALEPALLQLEKDGVRVDEGRLESARETARSSVEALRESLSLATAPEREAVALSLQAEGLAAKVASLKTERGKARALSNAASFKPEFNWESSEHVGRLFFEQFAGAPKASKTKHGAYSLAEKDVAELKRQLPASHPLAPVVENFSLFKKQLKLATTYTGDEAKGLLSKVEEGRIYTEYGQYQVTWRLSSRNPNLQNLPRKSAVKRFFCPDPGTVFLYGDYPQVELRIAAHLSQDPLMLEIFRDGGDPHRVTAAKIFGKSEAAVSDEERQIGKECNFLLIFGGHPLVLRDTLLKKTGKKFSEDECKGFIQAHKDLHPRYWQYLDEQLTFVKRFRCVLSEAGAVRRLPDIVYGEYLDWRNLEFRGPKELQDSLAEAIRLRQIPDRLKSVPEHELPIRLASARFSHAKKQAFNFPVQNLGRVVCGRAMLALRAEGFTLRNQVHDSLVAQEKRELAAERVPLFQKCLETAYTLSVPLPMETKVVASFDEKEELEPPFFADKNA